MSSFPLRKIAGVSWPEIPSGDVAQLWALYQELDRTQWRTRAEIIEGQLAQTRHLIAHCRQNVPYYADLLSRAGIKADDIRTLADFRRIPILRRQVYREQFARFQARALPDGVARTAGCQTSGTEGVALEIWQTNLVHLWWNACCLRDFAWCGMDVRGSMATIRHFGVLGVDSKGPLVDGLVAPQWNRQLVPLLETGRCFGMDVHHEPRHQLDWLLRVQPDYLVSYPSNLLTLASLLRASGQRFRNLRVVQTVSEPLSDDAQTRIETAYGAPVKNLYSCMEAGYLASPCPEGHGLHVHAENVLLEVLNDLGEPCQAGETGRVVLTVLHNHITPFLRYEISDSATLGPECCPCGRGLPLLTRVQGKIRPLFYLKDGGRKASHQLVYDLFELNTQHQIIQRDVDHFVVRVVPLGGWSQDHAERVVRCVRDYLAAPVRVDVQVVDRLEMTAAGKVRDVIIEYQPPEEAGPRDEDRLSRPEAR